MSVDRTKAPPAGPVRPFDFPHVRRGELPNGLRLLCAPHGDLPLVTAALIVDAGAEYEGAHEAGLARLTGEALEAGTGELSADDVAWEMERLGIELSVDVGWDAVVAGVTVPTERLDAALQLFSAIVRDPVFPTDEVVRLRDEQLADLLQRKKEPRALAGDMAARFIFRPETPYARPVLGTAAAVGEFDREHVRRFHRAHYGPARSTLVLVGDIAAADAERLAQRHFGDWSGPAPESAGFEVHGAVDRTSVFVVDRPGAVQSEIRIGHVGIERRHPDYFPLLVMNTLLGGAFTSRLNMSLRERHGFTYGARSYFAQRRRPGPFVVQVAVATEVTAAAVREAVHEIRGLAEGGPTAEEVDAARDYLVGVLPLQLQTTDALAARLADVVVYELPDDYFDHYRDRIAAVSPDEVRRVAAEHLRGDALAIVVVGDAAAIEEPLADLGLGPVEVHHVD